MSGAMKLQTQDLIQYTLYYQHESCHLNMLSQYRNMDTSLRRQKCPNQVFIKRSVLFARNVLKASNWSKIGCFILKLCQNLDLGTVTSAGKHIHVQIFKGKPIIGDKFD